MFQKFKIETSNMMYMKKMKYFGKNVQTQRIKARKRPKISVVRENKEKIQNENLNTQNLTSNGEKYIEFKVISEASIKEDEKNKNKSKNFDIIRLIIFITK